MSKRIGELTHDQLRELERGIAERKRTLEHAVWDSELVGRYFRIVRVKEDLKFWHPPSTLRSDSYVTLEESLAVGTEANSYVYADIVYLHIKSRRENELTCSGFEVSHKNRKEPYLKVQPVFFSWSDFRNYLNSWGINSGPAKHFDEISKEDYDKALRTSVASFAGLGA